MSGGGSMIGRIGRLRLAQMGDPAQAYALPQSTVRILAAGTVTGGPEGRRSTTKGWRLKKPVLPSNALQ
jgi:hypothetical protein